MQQSELNYFKEILESRKAQIIKNLKGVSDELEQIGLLELNDEGDYAAADNNSMIENAIAHQQEQELKEISVALSKISNGQYGICEMCEDSIGFQRLKVKPHAVYCIDCREIVEKTQKEK